MKYLSLVLLFYITFTGISQDKKFIKTLNSNDAKKIEQLKEDPEFQSQLDYHLVHAVHTFDTTLLDKCLELGANVHSPCGDCYGRDAITVALFYQNYDAYNKIKPLYNYTGVIDEIGTNILHAGASCRSDILRDVIDTYQPDFLFSEDGSPFMFCRVDDSTYESKNVQILIDNYWDVYELEILEETDPDYGTNILFDATYYNDLELVKYLVNLGFNPFSASSNFSREDFSPNYIGSAFMESLIHEDHKIYDFYRSLDYDFTQLQNWRLPEEELENDYGDIELYTGIAFYICQNTNEDFVSTIENEFLVDYNIYETIDYYNSPILFAIWDNNVMMVKRILEQDWDGYDRKYVLKQAKRKDVDPQIHQMVEKYVSENFK